MKNMDGVDLFYQEVVEPEVEEFLKNRESVSKLLAEGLGPSYIETVYGICLMLDAYLGKGHVFLRLLVRILLAKKHNGPATVEDSKFLESPTFIIAYTAFATTQEWFTNPLEGKHRVKRAKKELESMRKRISQADKIS